MEEKCKRRSQIWGGGGDQYQRTFSPDMIKFSRNFHLELSFYSMLFSVFVVNNLLAVYVCLYRDVCMCLCVFEKSLFKT